MNWIRTIGFVEIAFIIAFLILYLAFSMRYVYIARVLPVNFRRLTFKFFIRTLAFALIIIALLGPSFGDTRKEVKSIGKDIFILTDLSASMNAMDISPSRIERMKFELKKISNQFSTDRKGLIIFAAEAFVQCPLTFDQGALNIFIQTLSTNLVTSAGTDFAAPLELALRKFKEQDTLMVNEKSKIIILISDGEDFGEETEDIAKKIKKQGIKLFTLGIGTTQGSTIPTMLDGRYKINRDGNPVISVLNADALKRLALITNGKYFEISDKKNEVPDLVATIGQIEGELRETKKIDVANNKYLYFLFSAIILLLFDAMLPLKIVKV